LNRPSNLRVVWYNTFVSALLDQADQLAGLHFFSFRCRLLVFGDYWAFGVLFGKFALALAGHTVLGARHRQGVKRFRKVTPRGTQMGVWGSFAVH
jgi:hypothetical protein